MSTFNELVKKFDKIREYMREFYVYGFKSREELALKSLRNYDDDKRRIESYLEGYMSFQRSEKGKNIALLVNSRKIFKNPLYKAFKAKSFTKNDITLHFIILDILRDNKSFTARQLTDIICEKYLANFESGELVDTAVVRLKLSEYTKLGILKSEKQGKELYYSLKKLDIVPAEYEDLLSFFAEASPVGVLGSFIMDRFRLDNNKFVFKHSYIFHAVESEILCDIFLVINKKSEIIFGYYVNKKGTLAEKRAIPMKVAVSVQGGRRYLICISEGKKIVAYRLDNIKKIKIGKKIENYDELKELLEEKMKYIWGVSFRNLKKETLKMKIEVKRGEEYIIDRLKNEGRHGTVTQINDIIWEYAIDVYDPIEMFPWLRTFIGRIVSLECSNPYIPQKFYKDFEQMCKGYDANDIS